MYPDYLKKKTVTAISVTALCMSSVVVMQNTIAATLGQRAIYDMQILPAGHANQIGQCSAFVFGDVSAVPCVSNDTGGFGFTDNTDLPALVISGGMGVAADGLSGVVQIETGLSDGAGDNTFNVLSFQVDPYLNTDGGTFKTTINSAYPDPLGGAAAGGTISAGGAMALDVSARHGVAGKFGASLGIQPWNIDDSAKANVPGTNLYEGFTTGTDNNWKPSLGGNPAGVAQHTLTGRAIGDANTDTILDAVLVSAGNVGTAWGTFDGTPYTEAFNVQFVLVSAKPVAVDDLVVGHPQNPITIDIAAELLVNDAHADPAETISLLNLGATTGTNSTVVDNSNGTLTFTPPDLGVATDTFDYTITDLAGNLHTATVTVNLATGNAPDAVDDTVSTDEDTPLTFDPVLNNDDDSNGDTLTIISFDAATTALGTVVAGTGNELVYTPKADYYGPDSFNYTITDGNGNIASAVVYVTVDPINDPLVCTDVDLFTDVDTPLDIVVATDLLSTCTDIDVADTASFVSVQTPGDQGGIISNDGAGTLTFTPAAGFTGKDTFTYTATDSTDNDVRTISVTVGSNYGNFTMLNVAGDTFGGTNDVDFVWDGTLHTDSVVDLNSNLTMVSVAPQPFNGFVWDAHDARVFGPGTYSFDSGCTVAEVQSTGCPPNSAAASGPTLTMTVGADQVGLHVLFDWSTAANIDVVNVYDINAVWDDLGGTINKNQLWLGAAGLSPDPTTTWEWVSTDVDGDGIVGALMVDGPFIGYSANFNKGPGASSSTGAPVYTGTSSDTRLGSGSLGLFILLSNLFALIGFRYFSRKRDNG